MQNCPFAPLSLSDRAFVERVRGEDRRSSHCFASLYLWRDSMDLSILRGDRAFLIRCGAKGRGHYFFPCGDRAESLDMMLSLPEDACFHYASDADCLWLRETLPGRYVCGESRDDWEYLYDRAAQQDLGGKAYKSLRSAVNRSLRQPDRTVVSLDEVPLEELLDLTDRWEEMKGQSTDSSATRTALLNREALGLEGSALLRGGCLAAFALGSRVSSDTAILHVCKALDEEDFAGMDWELLRRFPPAVRLLNREEDLGLPGLRAHKLNLHPIDFLRLWTVTDRGRNGCV